MFDAKKLKERRLEKGLTQDFSQDLLQLGEWLSGAARKKSQEVGQAPLR